MVILILIVGMSVSCETAPKIDPQLRNIWSFKFKKCLCQMYDLNLMKPLEEPYVCDTSYCDDLKGFNTQIWDTKIVPHYKDVRRWSEDSCKAKK